MQRGLTIEEYHIPIQKVALHSVTQLKVVGDLLQVAKTQEPVHKEANSFVSVFQM